MAFFAYTSRDQELSIRIMNGIRRANAVTSSPVYYEPWEYNEISGTQLISPIISKIEESAYIVADITYINNNVIYEIGYAIGKNKKVFLIRNAEIEGDSELTTKIGIFDTIGYVKYSGPEDLRNILLSHVDESPLPFDLSLDRRAPVYIFPSMLKEEASQNLIARIKKARFRYRSFSTIEDIRLSATDAINQVARSAGIIAMYDQDNSIQGARSMFISGLADGMEKPLLLLSSYDTIMPLDVRDITRLFRHPDDISDFVADFCPLINSKLQETLVVTSSDSNLLSRISVGDPTAENEMTTIDNYYLETDQFLRAMRGEVNLVVGRKGSGKTALFISLRNATRSDKRNIVVDLKPESYQLLKLKEKILSYLTEGSQQYLITAFWEYLILLEVAYKLLEKDKRIYRQNHNITELYQNLEEIYQTEESVSEGDFSERLMNLSESVTGFYKNKFGASEHTTITTQDLTEILYRHDIKNLKILVSKYLNFKGNVLVLFDNIDKSWSTLGVDRADATTLRCLIDASRKVERDMQRQGHVFRCVVFVRNDVYQHLMANSADYGKEMRAALDWSDPDLLREMLFLGLLSNLDSEDREKTFEEIWSLIASSHVLGEESSSFIIDRSLMRPRNVLKLFSHARAFAVNFRKNVIEEEDFVKGYRTYSQDLLTELDREISDVHPEARNLLYYFVGSEPRIDHDKLFSFFSEAEIDVDCWDSIRDFLLYHGVLGINVEQNDFYIFDFGYDLRQIEIRLKRAGNRALFVINPAFVAALGIRDSLLEQYD